MVSFELGIEIEKDVFCHVTSVGQRKKDWGERGTKRKISELTRRKTSFSILAHFRPTEFLKL